MVAVEALSDAVVALAAAFDSLILASVAKPLASLLACVAIPACVVAVEALASAIPCAIIASALA